MLCEPSLSFTNCFKAKVNFIHFNIQRQSEETPLGCLYEVFQEMLGSEDAYPPVLYQFFPILYVFLPHKTESSTVYAHSDYWIH